MVKKFKTVIYFILSILLIVGFAFYYYSKPERLIKNYLQCISDNNYEDISKYQTSRHPKANENSIDYIDYIERINIKPITDETAVNDAYFHRIQARQEYQNLSKNDFKIYRVSYNLKVKDNVNSPVDSGEFTKSYLLIKEDNKWKIDSIEEC